MTKRISRFDKEWATRRGVGAPNQTPGPKSGFTSAGGGADFQGRAGGMTSAGWAPGGFTGGHRVVAVLERLR
jgi:hypothetical protein